MGEKLTPRVGDRVIVSGGIIPTDDGGEVWPTTTGIVTQVGSGGDHKVELDIKWDGERCWWFPADRLEVRDREPVSWPERWGPSYAGCVRVTAAPGLESYNVDRAAFDLIRGPEGDYVAEHWPELMGDDRAHRRRGGAGVPHAHR